MKNLHSGLDGKIGAALSVRLQRRGVPRYVLQRAYGDALRNETPFFSELVQQPGVTEALLYSAIADLLGLEFTQDIEMSRIFVTGEEKLAVLTDVWQVMLIGPDGQTCLCLAPDEKRIAMLLDHVSKSPSVRSRIRICPPSLLRQIMRQRHSRSLLDQAGKMTPRAFSAARVLHAPQVFGLAAILYVLVACAMSWPFETMLAGHVFLTLFFFGCVLLRLFAAAKGERLRFARLLPIASAALPIYSILVPLYREQAVIGQLIAVLQKLNWPSSKLEIKLVCEEDDFDTKAAIRRYDLPANFEVITVPAGGPRTKPNALNYALQFVRGEIVAVFDAEDRPHPDQLREAWQAFRMNGESLACVQAPLIIGNYRRNMLTRMFAFEYAALFRGLLPWLAAQGLVIPLGGTSNHFRSRCLREVGGWDAFNVTEDADLGIRLARFGYRIGMIGRGTIEDAPEDYKIWRNQRTRWIKGWMQTWLVHARNPYRAMRELGLWRFIVSQIYMIGIISSALIHPFMLIMLAGLLAKLAYAPVSPQSLMLLGLDMVNILLAYLSFYILGSRTLEPTESGGYAYLFAIPVYWVLISFSAWRALWQLIREPHLWEKTPHHPSVFYFDAAASAMNTAPRPIMD